MELSAHFGEALHPQLSILSLFFREREAERALRSKRGGEKKKLTGGGGAQLAVGAAGGAQLVAAAGGALLPMDIGDEVDLAGLEVQCRGATLAVQVLVI